MSGELTGRGACCSFKVPILSPDKPTTCTINLMKANYEAYLNDWMTAWGFILDDVVNQKVLKIGGQKGCALTPFIYYLYARNAIL